MMCIRLKRRRALRFRNVFMTDASSYDPWLSVTPSPGFLHFDDSYYTEGSSVILVEHSLKRGTRPGFTPLGMVPTTYTSRIFRARSRGLPVQPARQLSTSPSARLHKRIQNPPHDEHRADYSRFPQDMVNPWDTLEHVQPIKMDVSSEDKKDHSANLMRTTH
jgi:hypothetical protein